MIDMKRTGRQLKEHCDRRGLSVREIQKRLHIGSFQSVYAWFQGKTLPSLDNFYALAKLLGASMESLIVEKRITGMCDYALRAFPRGLFLEICSKAAPERCVLYVKRLGTKDILEWK